MFQSLIARIAHELRSFLPLDDTDFALKDIVHVGYSAALPGAYLSGRMPAD